MPALLMAASTPKSPRSKSGLVVLLVLVVSGAVFLQLRRLATQRAQELHQRALSFAHCALGSTPAEGADLVQLLERRVELMTASARPLSGCEPARAALSDARTSLVGTPLHRAPQQAQELGTLVDSLSEYDYSASAEDWTKNGARARALAEAIAQILSLSCQLAVAEGVYASAPCPREIDAATPRPRPHVLTDARLAGRLSKVSLETSLFAKSGWLFAAAATERGTQLFAVSVDAQGARSFEFPTAGFAEPEVSPAGQLDGKWLLTLLDRKTLAGRVYQVEAERIALLGELPALPAGAKPVSTGARVVALSNNRFAMPLERPAAESDALLYFGFGSVKPELVSVSEGRIAGAFSAEPRLIVVRRAEAGRAEVVNLEIPVDPRAPRRVFSSAFSRLDALQFVPSLENWCGLPNERLASVLAQPADHPGTLLSLGGQRVFRFEHDARAARLVCGSCPAGVLKRSPQGELELRTLVRRSLARAPLEPPLAAGLKAREDAEGSCTPEAVILSYVASGSLLVQRTEKSSWRFGQAQRVAEPDHNGEVGAARLLSIDSASYLVWVRPARDRSRLRLEYLKSTDSGAHWK